MSIVHLERITCDNPECEIYVEELIREEPGRYELVEYVRSQISLKGWSTRGELDFCPPIEPGNPSLARPLPFLKSSWC